MFFKKIITFVKSIYDKLIALVVLAIFVASLLYLAVKVGAMRIVYDNYIKSIEQTTPDHPESEKMNAVIYDEWVNDIENPFSAKEDQWLNRMFVTETRIKCWECKNPIEYLAEICPFCKGKPPTNAPSIREEDADHDGIDDLWEEQYGLDPYNAKDAALDIDKDLFSNLKEFQADPQTDPTNAASHPPFSSFLVVREINSFEIPLKFQSKSKLPDGTYKFGINDPAGRRTDWGKIGEEVMMKQDKNKKDIVGTGFKVIKFEIKMDKERVGKGNMFRKIDISELTLERAGKTVVLVYRKSQKHKEYRAKIAFTLTNAVYDVKKDTTFEVNKSEKYKVINIDSNNESILIRNLRNEKETRVRKGSLGVTPKASVGIDLLDIPGF